MASPKQLAANRANAEQSTGPRTPAGKAAASRNAIRHGLFARDVVIAGECAQAFARLESALAEEAAPQNALEAELIRQLAGLLWRLRRIERLEAGILTACARLNAIDDDRGPPAAMAFGWSEMDAGGAPIQGDEKTLSRGRDDGALVARSTQSGVDAIGRAFMRDADGAIERLSRHEARLRRSVERVLQELHRARIGIVFEGKPARRR